MFRVSGDKTSKSDSDAALAEETFELVLSDRLAVPTNLISLLIFFFLLSLLCRNTYTPCSIYRRHGRLIGRYKIREP